MTAESRRTSFYALTGTPKSDGVVPVERIEIPLFQRDYAQGRGSKTVERIRTDFLDALLTAITGGATASLGLDFVYGGIDGGTLHPLDGQQRLTTLFLLHWYVASRSGNFYEDHGWKRFSYATRQSARMFCESLANHPLPDGKVPKKWITDQPWYMYLWRHDPTIGSMLVMLDAIDERFRDVDAAMAWARLTDAENPAIWFLLLPLSDLGSTAGKNMKAEELYIKMNSRGKPLTEFETFKAHFEKTIRWSPRSAEFARKVDTTWSDLMWHQRDNDNLIDDQLLRYFEFVTEICEWRDGRTDGAGQRLGKRTQAVFGEQNPARHANLDFLFQALDIWERHPINEMFNSLFAGSGGDGIEIERVRLFFRRGAASQEPLNLFKDCCRSYGETRGRVRVFSLGQTIVLYAVLLHLTEGTPNFPRRVRILRNLIEASTDELRPKQMPKILNDVGHIIRDGALDPVKTLNQAQLNDEKLKAAFLAAYPDMGPVVFELEDHELLRGSLGAFELESATFKARASVFRKLMSRPDMWSELLASLLAVGEYQRRRTGGRPFLFGTDSKQHESAWRNLLTGPSRDELQPTRRVLAAFLDRVAASPEVPLAEVLREITKEYLSRCEVQARFDWRYYMVKYPSMRENGSSTYFAERLEDEEQTTMGYSLCMLQANGTTVGGYYRDPYLLTIWRELNNTADVEDKWFTGHESLARRLPLKRSGASIRCIPAGFELTPPSLNADAERFASACADIGVDSTNCVRVPQVEVDGHRVDTVDRIQKAADILRRLLAASL